ncbi:MAG: hypothetical protein COB36_08050 [Alphaproteobacteria bacterium]|nr:MAG: hypothetical protein COB36_08050 [Alphaproteobacteria bacterium]
MTCISKYILIGFCSVFMSAALMSGHSFAQDIDDVKLSYEDVSYSVRVINSMTLVSGDVEISLWGIEKIRAGASIFHLKIRGALEKEVGGQDVLCTIKERYGGHNVKAQCINDREADLSLFLLQNGYASADRAAIYGSVYERPYLDAEENARSNGLGAWADNTVLSSGDVQSKNFMMGAFFLMAVFILALALLGFYIMRGFGRVVDIQNQSIDLASKERALKDKEKYIVASIIDAEIKANKSKIDAYIMVYEEVLQRLDNKDITPKYQKTGEIIQKQPVLDRSVFDGNTNKLGFFGARLASDIIHYYARIKTVPDYVEITPDMPQSEVIDILARVVGNAQKMNELSDQLIEEFMQQALIKRVDV